MLKKAETYGKFLIAAIIISFAIPLISSGKDGGQDWYCSKPEEHARYMNHRKLHIDHNAEVVASMLEKIYNDPSLSSKQRHAKVLTLLKKDLSKIHIGDGVGD